MSGASLQPYAITMWDFSWLERRWPGAGYEDWDRVLDELLERGYDAVRIDPYPHLVAAGADRQWELLPVWTQNTWGAQSVVQVRVVPALLEFIGKAQERGVRVALSTWFRRDRDDVRMRIGSPADLAAVWTETLRVIDEAGLLDAVLFVDLCNEFPLPIWTPFLYGSEDGEAIARTDDRVPAYMEAAIAPVRAAYPGLPFTFSFAGEYDTWADQNVRSLDLLEPHVWMAAEDVTDFYARVGYAYERYGPEGYDNLVARARSVYLAGQERYDALLFDTIDRVADWSRATGKPLVTTECWSIIDYKDWPGLEWDWVLDLNRRAVQRAAATGRWTAMATSNFAGPQFRGVWREIAYHRELTDLIRSACVAPDLSVPAAFTRPSASHGRRR